MDLKSGCHQAPIIEKGEFWKTHHCQECGKAVSFGMMIDSWATQEACAVVKDFHGDYYFVWHILTDPKDVVAAISRGQKLVCPVMEMVDSIGIWHQTQDTDTLPIKEHYQFMKEYVDMVENPEVAVAFFNANSWGK